MIGRWRTSHALVLLGLLPWMSGCHRRQEPSASPTRPHYVVGLPWQGADGAWFYPREQLSYHATGLATVASGLPGGLTADGERFDPDAMAAAHQTLQLPCVIVVRNLENGLTILVRVNDRGPAQQGRVLSLTRRAASLLGMIAGVPARVDIALDLARSQAASEGAEGGPRLEVAAAPVEGVQEEALPAPGGNGGGVAGAAVDRDPGSRSITPADATTSDRLPTAVQQGVPDPGALWIDGGQFGQRGYADQVAAELGGSVRSEGQGRQVVYTVREGPFQRTSDADAALDQARRAGVTGAHIIVE